MLFSIPESGWWLIAAAATLVFMVGMRALSSGMKLPDDLRDTMKQQGKGGRWAFYLLTPAFAGAVLATSLLRPEPASPILFLYSVAFASIPAACLPVRGRMLKTYIVQQRNPGTKVKPDRLAMAWIGGSLSVVCLAAVLALTTTGHGPPG
ncbi:hypothetical protein [Actinomadura rubrisoli]|uniref:Uncharacterized protein n=1 Tax=Actinomadura rubrisoli TaxID=2530368 RepID=A0A4R5C2H3_9ACTN|nr:hypothetical protein [Actinomadura rubrisoli]TDD93025.1 hypothetical protein E1298_10440 [Actinomadura rubrisoli]